MYITYISDSIYPIIILRYNKHGKNHFHKGCYVLRILGCDMQEETVLEIGKFAILWNCFERDYCNNNCNPEKIKEVTNRIIIAKERNSNFANVINQRRHWFGQDIEDYVRDSLHPGNSRASKAGDTLSMERFLAQDDKDLVVGCLLVIYRIRNNLMHGMKGIEELEGQIELFRAANDVLEDIRWKLDC